MATPTSLTSAARSTPHNLASLYRLLLRTSQSTFQGDARMVTAWRSHVRQKLAAQVASGQANSGSKLSDEIVTEWLDVVKILRMNVVQGVQNKEGDAYRLRFTPDTELGSNETIKAGRDKQMADLRASKGSLGCGGGGGGGGGGRPNIASSSSSSSPSAPSPSSSSSSMRTFTTSARLFKPRDISKLPEWPPEQVPHPPPQFPSTTFLADGSSIQLTTTMPRKVTNLTRDFTNHPLWNPRADARANAGQDEGGRMGRFRKRFSGTENDDARLLGNQNAQVLERPATASKQATSEAGPAQSTPVSDEAKPAGSIAQQTPAASPQAPSGKPTAARSKAMFDLDDLDWMSGGRESKGKDQDTRTPAQKARDAKR